MTIQRRASGCSDTGATSSTTQVGTLPTGWQPGDFCINAAVHSATGGTWTTPPGWGVINAGTNTTGGFSYAIYYRVLRSGDTAPTFTYSVTGVWSWGFIGWYSDAGLALVFDAQGTEVDTATGGTSYTPPSAVASGTGEASTIIVLGRNTTSVTPTAVGGTPSSGWTQGGIDAAQLNVAGNTRVCTVTYKTGVSGTSTPGAGSITLTGATASLIFSSQQVLIKEAPVAPPYVAFAGTIASGSTSYVETITANTVAGDGVLVYATGGGTGVASGVTDTKGNTYTLIQSQQTTNPRTFLFAMTAGFAALTTAAADKITVNYSSAPSSNGTIQVVGVPGCPYVDMNPAVATGTSTAPTISTTPSGSNEIAIGLFAWANAAGVGSAFSYPTLVQTVPSGAAYATIGYNAAPSSGVSTANSATVVSAFWNALIVVMKSTASAFIPVGAWGYGGNAGTIALVNQSGSNLLLAEVHNYTNNTVFATGLSGGGANWTQIGTTASSAGGATGYHATHTLFAGTVTAVGSQSATITWSGTTPTNIAVDVHEFFSYTGQWFLDVQSNLDSAATANWPSLTPSGSNELYFGSEINAATAVVGTTLGYAYNVNAAGCGAALNANCPSGSATFPVWGDSHQRTGIMALVRSTSAGTTYAVAGTADTTPSMSASGSITALALISGSSTATVTTSGSISSIGAITGLSDNTSLNVAYGDGVMFILRMGILPLLPIHLQGATTQWQVSGYADATVSMSATGTISATGVITGTSSTTSAGNGTIAQRMVVAGLSATASSASGTISALGVISGSSSSTSTGAGTVTLLMALSGSSSTSSSASGAITRIGALAGSSAAVSSASGAIVMTLVTSGTSTAVSSASATISATGVISGSSAAVSSANGTIVAIGVISGTSTSVSSASGSFGLIAAFSGSSLTSSSASGTVTLQAVISGSSPNTSSASGNVNIAGGAQTWIAAGSSATTSVGSGAVVMTMALSGTAPAVSSASGTLSLKGVVAGSSTAAVVATGTVAAIVVVSGQSATTSSGTGSFGTGGTITGSSTTASAASGVVVQTMVVSGSSSTVSSASGSLGKASPLAGSSSTSSSGTGAITLVVGGTIWQIAGSSSTQSNGTGSFSALAAISGISVTASSATGAVTLKLVIAGLSVTVSQGYGAIGEGRGLSGTSATASAGSGALTAILRVAGLSVTVSSGTGAIAPPFQAGAMPPVVTALVFVNPAPSVTIGLNLVGARVTIDTVAAQTSVDEATANVFVEPLTAEVT